MLTALYVLLARGSFNNYVDKKRIEGFSIKVHTLVTLKRVSRHHVKCPREGGGGQNWVKFGPRSCGMTPWLATLKKTVI